MKSEMTNTQAAPAGGGGGQPEHGVQVGTAPVRRGRHRPGQLPGQVQDVGTPGARRDDPLDPVVIEDRADPVAALGEQPPEGDRQFGEDRVLAVPGRPDRIDADWSSTSQAVSSRSWVYWRT